MSYSNKTTHFEIPLPLGTDLTTPMDYNTSMEAIDTALFTAAGDAATASQNASDAVNTANGAAADVLTLGGRVNNVESTQTTQGNAIIGLNNAVTALQNQTPNKLDSVAIADPYDAEHGIYAVGNVVTYNGQRYKCTTAVTAAEPFDVDKWTGEDVQTVLDNLSTPVAANVSLSAITGMTADDVQEGISELNTNIGDISSLTTTDKSSAVAAINEVKSDLGNLKWHNVDSFYNGGTISFNITNYDELCLIVKHIGSNASVTMVVPKLLLSANSYRLNASANVASSRAQILAVDIDLTLTGCSVSSAYWDGSPCSNGDVLITVLGK